MDQIIIRDLKLFAHHGVFERETQNGQYFYVDAVLFTDTRAAGKSDCLDLSTNYGEVCLFIDDFLTKNTYQLLEAAAERLAEEILLKFPLLSKLKLEIKKPQAPIPLPFGCVSVCIERGWHRAYIALGSSMGERENYLETAVCALREDRQIRLHKVSQILRTKPYGNAAKEEFLNGVIEIDTLYTPEELLDCLQALEQKAGRVREIHWGDRTLDLDILLYDDIVLSSERLTIPHADMVNRDFVLEPLSQIAPWVIHPLQHKTAAALREELARRVSCNQAQATLD